MMFFLSSSVPVCLQFHGVVTQLVPCVTVQLEVHVLLLGVNNHP